VVKPVLVSTDLLDRAQRWLDHDPDSNARAELAELLSAARRHDEKALTDLSERFSGPLEFGTAGLRGVIGAGESRMNRAVVLRTTAGFARYLLDQPGLNAASRGIVIGYDGRRMSREFAEDTACALAAAGIRTYVSPRPCPTPLTAYAVTKLGAAGGVMVTASHNPPEYNGYKVYWENGAQIIPPHDKGISAAIDRQPGASSIARMSLDEAREKGLVRTLDDAIERQYLDAIGALGVHREGDRGMPIVYTPLHGVGERLLRRAMTEAGFTNVISVAEQAEPDGAFPTVAFPNPEEKGALDLAYALAEKTGARLIIANDPDVDRLAVAVKDATGKWIQLTGNQVGVLLGHYLLTEGSGAHGDRVVLASLVSSPMLGAIAQNLGVRYEETLTGFKWIANRAIEIERATGARFVFGYEEALGYTVGPVVRDKDGISAALIVAEIAANRAASGLTLLDELDAIARKHGLFVSGQRAITLRGSDGLARIGQVMTDLRDKPIDAIGPLAVLSTSDLGAQTKRMRSGAVETLPLPPSNVVVYQLEGGSRVIARPSGTEPKIKFYFDVRETIGEGETIAAASARALARVDELANAFCALTGVS